MKWTFQSTINIVLGIVALYSIVKLYDALNPQGEVRRTISPHQDN